MRNLARKDMLKIYNKSIPAISNSMRNRLETKHIYLYIKSIKAGLFSIFLSNQTVCNVQCLRGYDDSTISATQSVLCNFSIHAQIFFVP